MSGAPQKPPAKGMGGMQVMEEMEGMGGWTARTGWLTARAFAGWIVKTAVAVRVRILHVAGMISAVIRIGLAAKRIL